MNRMGKAVRGAGPWRAARAAQFNAVPLASPNAILWRVVLTLVPH